MTLNKNEEKNKIIFISRSMPHYRLPIIEKLNDKIEETVILINSKNKIPGEKAHNFTGSSKLKNIALEYKGSKLNFFGKIYPYGWFKSIYKVLKKESPDLLILEGESNFLNNIIVFFYCVFNKVPYIWWSCGRVRDQKESLLRKIFKPIIGLLVRNSSAVLGYSSYACRYFERKYKIDSKKTYVACNSLLKEKVDSSINKLNENRYRIRRELKIENDSPVLLYVGAVVKEKKPDFFFHIYKKIEEKIPNVHAILVGGGNYLDNIKILSQKSNSFHVVGPVNDNVESYFLESDVYIMPGLGGLGLQQAMMCSKPVISSVADGTELDLIIDGLNGYYMELESSVDDWANKIINIISNKNLKKSMGIESRKIIDTSFNSDIMISRINDGIRSSLKI
jgi:glycosyltransferase involved in cell wall biosynthesis